MWHDYALVMIEIRDAAERYVFRPAPMTAALTLWPDHRRALAPLFEALCDAAEAARQSIWTGRPLTAKDKNKMLADLCVSVRSGADAVTNAVRACGIGLDMEPLTAAVRRLPA